MNSIENITKKIRNDAHEYAEQALRKAKDRADGIISDARQKAEDIRLSYTERAAAESKAIINRASSSADILGRNILLDAKSVVLDNIYARSELMLTEDVEGRYYRFLESSLRDAMRILSLSESAHAEKEEAFVLILNEKDKKVFGDRLLDYANGSSTGIGRTAVLSEIPGDFSAGLVLRLGDTQVSAVLKELINDIKLKTEKDVYKLLFSISDGSDDE